MKTVNVGPARPLTTLQAGFDALEPGDTLQCDPGEYAGVTWYAAGPGPDVEGTTTKILGGPGVKITSGNKRSSGFTIEGRNGLVIDGFEMVGLGDSPQGAGIMLAGCSNVVIRNVSVDLPREFGANISCCHNVLIEDSRFTRARFQHGVYFGNSSTKCVIRGCKLLGNKFCGIQANGDKATGSFWGFENTGEIQGLFVGDCIFGWNGIGGGADLNLDCVVGFDVFGCHFLATDRGKGNAITFFRSGYNPGPTRDGVVADCNIVVGKGRYNCLRFEHTAEMAGAKDIKFKNCNIVHTGFPAKPDAGWVELFQKDGPPDIKLKGIEFDGCNFHGAVVIQDTIKSRLDLDAAFLSYADADVAAVLAGLPVEADPGEIVAPPAPPPDKLPPMPATGEVATPADMAKVNLDERGSVWLREWKGPSDRFGDDFLHQRFESISLLDRPFWGSPISDFNRNDPGFSLRIEAYWKAPRTEVIEVRVRSRGGYDHSFAGVTVLSGESASHAFEEKTRAFQVEAGKFYHLNLGASSRPDTVVIIVYGWRSAAAPDAYQLFDVVDLYRPMVGAKPPPIDPPPPVDPTDPIKPPVPVPATGDDIVIRFAASITVPAWLKSLVK